MCLIIDTDTDTRTMELATRISEQSGLTWTLPTVGSLHNLPLQLTICEEEKRRDIRHKFICVGLGIMITYLLQTQCPVIVLSPISVAV